MPASRWPCASRGSKRISCACIWCADSLCSVKRFRMAGENTSVYEITGMHRHIRRTWEILREELPEESDFVCVRGHDAVEHNAEMRTL